MTGNASSAAPTAPFGGGRSVLVVEDEHRVRAVTRARLADLGFSVLEAGDASAAMDLMAAHPEIEIVYSDVLMPGALSGLDLAKRVQELYPNMHIVLTSGYSAELIREAEGGSLDLLVLRKPYRQAELARVFREILRQRGPLPGSPATG